MFKLKSIQRRGRIALKVLGGFLFFLFLFLFFFLRVVLKWFGPFILRKVIPTASTPHSFFLFPHCIVPLPAHSTQVMESWIYVQSIRALQSLTTTAWNDNLILYLNTVRNIHVSVLTFCALIVPRLRDSSLFWILLEFWIETSNYSELQKEVLFFFSILCVYTWLTHHYCSFRGCLGTLPPFHAVMCWGARIGLFCYLHLFLHPLRPVKDTCDVPPSHFWPCFAHLQQWALIFPFRGKPSFLSSLFGSFSEQFVHVT